MKIIENSINTTGVGALIFEFDGYVYSIIETGVVLDDDDDKLEPFKWFKRTKLEDYYNGHNIAEKAVWYPVDKYAVEINVKPLEMGEWSAILKERMDKPRKKKIINQ